jgi:hypothetical protein
MSIIIPPDSRHLERQESKDSRQDTNLFDEEPLGSATAQKGNFR